MNEMLVDDTFANHYTKLTYLEDRKQVYEYEIRIRSLGIALHMHLGAFSAGIEDLLSKDISPDGLVLSSEITCKTARE